MAIADEPVRDELARAFPHADLHPSWCDCGLCAHDARSSRIEPVQRVQAFLLGAFLIGLYALIFAFAPEILGALKGGQ